MRLNLYLLITQNYYNATQMLAVDAIFVSANECARI